MFAFGGLKLDMYYLYQQSTAVKLEPGTVFIFQAF